MKTETQPACIFCSKPTNSVEDVMPQWLLRTVGALPRLVAKRGGKRPRERSVQSLKLKARLTCRECNNEWMSGLENETKPVLSRMLRSEFVLLSPKDQEVLARWAQKTAMVAEFTLGLDPDQLYWTSAERAAFAAKPHALPNETDVLMGRYTGNLNVALLKGGSSPASRLSSGAYVAQMTRVMILCRPVILVVEHNRGRSVTGNTTWVWPPPHYDRLEQIHPQLALPLVKWPTTKSLGDREFDEFTKEIRDHGPTSTPR